MSTATLTSNGQIALPKSIRDRLALKVGIAFAYRPTARDESCSTASVDQQPATCTACSSVWPRPRLRRSTTCVRPYDAGPAR